MVFSKYNKDRPFLLITRRATPPIGARTENKGWSAESGWHVEEEISIVDKVEEQKLIQDVEDELHNIEIKIRP